MTPARRRALLLPLTLALGATALVLLAPRAQAQGLPTNTGHTDPSPQWDAVRPKLFGERAMATGNASLVHLYVPLRAAYGASVPVKITSEPGARMKTIWLIVDKNPSPIAATLTIGPALPRADFETRLRVDEYSHVRVVAEAADGSLHTDSRYVKVSGGCSAPPNRDHPERIGQTTVRQPEPGWAEVSTVHPNDSGFELNQVTVMFIPPHFIRTMRVMQGDAMVFSTDQDFSIAENPSWRFAYDAPPGAAPLTAEVSDSKDGHFRSTPAPR